uniref:Nucleosome-remodeling factor subunit BPTF n=2 Tax=Mesocestoides corti TaxID=53468 RepID=A0A5K3EWY1_MESCO
MDEPLERSEVPNMPLESGDDHGPKKRPKLTFINPAEWVDFEQKCVDTPISDADRNLCRRLVDRQAKSEQEEAASEVSEIGESKLKKKPRQRRSRKSRSKKRPTDPKRPWLDSDGEEADCALPLDDDSDDDAFLQRLAEEKEREEAEEIKRKQELKRQRQLKREERRSRATGRPGRPRAQLPFAHLYSNSTDDPQSSSKPSEASDGEQSPLNEYGDDDEIIDFPPPPSIEPDNSNEHGAAAGSLLDNVVTNDSTWLNAVVLRRRAPPLTLPPSSQDLLCPPEHLLEAVSIYRTLRQYGRLLRLSPFQLEDFLSALVANENSVILAEVHMVLLNALITEDEVNGTHLCPPDCKDAFSLMSGFLIDRYTWPYILALYLSSIKRGEAAAITALARVGSISTVGTAGPVAAVTTSGGADVVVTSALFFPDDVIPLDPSYPFVGLPQRLAILRGLVGLFLATGPVRGDILREGFTAHDDFCRVCRQSGEVLCCDNCPAVFHLSCLTPPLAAVPNTSWHCPLCATEQEAYGKKKIPKLTGQVRIPSLGYDRAGRVYWHIEGRLFVEPVDFAQREPELPGLFPGVHDENWERLEADKPGDLEDGSDEVGSEGACDPTVAYANEPHVYYYSSLDKIRIVRQQLSTQWEPALCAQLDALIPQDESEVQEVKPSTKPEPTEEESKAPMVTAAVDGVSASEPDMKKEDAEEVDTKPTTWPPLLPLPPALTPSQLTSVFSNSQLSGDEETSMTSPMKRAYVLEMSGGVLVHNQDGIFENFPLSQEEYAAQLSESRPSVVASPLPPTDAAAPPPLRWRGWTNTLSRGLFVPNPSEATADASVNIALNRLQQHDEKERRRLLSNKFSLTDLAMEAWQWLDSEAAANMLLHAVSASEDGKETEHEGEVADPISPLRRRADAVGPARWLHTVKLTLCYVEAQLPAAALCPAWRLVRKDWIAAVLKATSVQDLADLLARLEAAIRPVVFQRIWTSSIGPLQLDRFTSAQREEEKRIRALERSTAAFNGLPATLVRTKTIQPIRHTVWKTRGEEYRRLGGDGWQWLSVTRRRQRPTAAPQPSKPSSVDRPPHLGLGWGVQPELLSRTDLHPRVSQEPILDYGLHPITGVPLCRNAPRCVYKVSCEALQEEEAETLVKKDEAMDVVDDAGGDSTSDKHESQSESVSVIDISRCLRDGGGRFFPPPARSPPPSPKTRRGRRHFHLDLLLAVREAAASRDLEASEAARRDLDQLREQRDALAARVSQIRSRLAHLATEAQSARSEHAKAVKARQAAIAEIKRLSQQPRFTGCPPSYGVTRPFTPIGHGGGGGGGGKGRKGGHGTAGRRPATSRRLQREEYNYDSGDSANSDDSAASSSSPPGSSTTGSNVLRRSSRRQKAKSVDPDFVVDFDEDDEEDEGGGRNRLENEDLEFRRRDSDDDGDRDVEYRPSTSSNVQSWVHGGGHYPRASGLPQFDGPNDDDDCGTDENSGDSGLPHRVLIKSIPTTTLVTSSSTGERQEQKPSATVVPPSGKSLLAQAFEGKAPAVVQIRHTQALNGDTSEGSQAQAAGGGGGGGGVTVLPTPVATTTPGGQPVRLVRVLRGPPGTPAGTQIIQTVDPNSGGVATTSSAAGTNLIIPAATDSALQKSLIQLSSGGGVIVTQASTLPAGYRLITPSSLPLNTTASTSTHSTVRNPLNFVQVVSTSAPVRARAVTPQLTPKTPLQPPSLVSIAPSPLGANRGSALRPLLAPANRPMLTPQLAPSLRPRMMRVVPMELDPSLDLAVSNAAKRLHEVDLEMFNLRKELKQLELQLAEVSVQVEEKEELVKRSGCHTAYAYSLNINKTHDALLLDRLDRAVKAAAATSRPPGRRFLVLPKHLPPINAYSWPPDPLFYANTLSDHPKREEGGKAPDSVVVTPSLFRLNRANLRGVILAAGRKDIPGYEAEKKRLASIPWSYPTARPCFAEAWRFRLRQIVNEGGAVSRSTCGELNAPSHYGVLLASLATNLRFLWHCLRWDDLVVSAGVCEDAALDAFDRYCLKLVIAESHGGGFTLRRLTAIQPLDKYWLRANFLVQTSVHKPATRKRANRVASRSTLGSGDDPPPRRWGRARRFADPDYDPAVDEGWRVGVPCSNANNSRRRRNPRSDEENNDEVEEERVSEEAAADDNASTSKRDARKEEWVSEDALQLWEIRNFFDNLLPIDGEYPPPMPPLALSGLPEGLVSDLSVPVKTDDCEDNTDGRIPRGSWIQPARCPSPEPPKAPSPKPPPPPSPPPPAPVVVDPPKPLLISSSARPLAPSSTPMSVPQPAFRPLIVNSSRPQGLQTPVMPGHQFASNPMSQVTNTSSYTLPPPLPPPPPPHPAPKRTSAPPAPLSPKSEAARARARSLAASHAARISAANRRFRTEKAALETRATALAEELANRRRLTVKVLALQVQEDILRARKAQQGDISESPTPERLSPLPSPKPLAKAAGGARGKSPVVGKRGSSRQSAIARQQPLRRSPPPPPPMKRSPTTPETDPATDSDEERCAMHAAPPKATQLDLERAVREERMMKNTTGAVAPTPRGRRPGRPRGGAPRQVHAKPASPPAPVVAKKVGGGRGKARGKGRGGASKAALPRPRLPIRTPNYLLKEAEEEEEGASVLASQSDVEDETSDGKSVPEGETDEDKVYCICKQPYDPSQEYIGCDLCQDWFHFTCVGLKPGSSPALLGDSWHCPDCQRDENKASEEVYCLCRTPYDAARVYIACDQCDEWYHAECVGLKPEAAANHEGEYICPACVKKAGVGTSKSKADENVETKADKGDVKQKTLYEASLTEPVKKAVDKLLADLQAHKLSWPFMKPFPVLALRKLTSPPKEPTDLIRFMEAFKRGAYRSLGDVSLAGNRLFSNARLVYTNDSPEFYCTEVLEAMFVRRMKEIRALTEAAN